MERDTFYADINKEAHARRLKWGHISNYPAVLIEQLLQDKTMTVEERNELIQWQIGSDPYPSTWMPVLLADLRAENEQLRALLEEASDLLSDAVDVTLYGGDASGHFSVYKAEEWERRYQALTAKPIKEGDIDGNA